MLRNLTPAPFRRWYQQWLARSASAADTVALRARMQQQLRLGLLAVEPGPSLRNIFPGFSLATKLGGMGTLPHPIGLGAGLVNKASTWAAAKELGASFGECGPCVVKPAIYGDGSGTFSGDMEQRQFTWPNSAVPLQNFAGEYRAGSAPQMIAWKPTQHERVAEELAAVMLARPWVSRHFVWTIGPHESTVTHHEQLYLLKSLLGTASRRLWLRLAPELSKSTVQDLVELAMTQNFGGLIACGPRSIPGRQGGVVTGASLAAYSCNMLEWAYAVHQGTFPMIAAGGIFSGTDIYERLRRGACAVEVFSVLFLRHPLVIKTLLDELLTVMRQRRIQSVSDILLQDPAV